MKKILMNKYILYILFTIAGLFLGWLFFHSSDKGKAIVSPETEADSHQSSVWTCAMHPQIRMDKPGKCPICGMDLIPLNRDNTAVFPEAVHLTKEAVELANVLTSVVTKQKPVKEVRLYGKVQINERLLQSQVVHISGRIEKLFVNFTGESVSKGQTLALIYSPELVTAQQELIEAFKSRQDQPGIYQAAKDKLRQWELTDNQISNIENSGKVQDNFEVYSNTTGVVTARRVTNGDYVARGTILFDIADLSSVWVMFDAYENDLPFINEGDRVDFSVQAIPGVQFSGRIAFISPVIDPVTRVSKVRVEIENKNEKLKPEMFVTGIVNANLKGFKNSLVIPRSAVLWTGKRSIVYVKQKGIEEPVYNIREIELGPQLENSYVVVNGLSEGEEIVTQGAFSVDAAAQLEGLPSMMNPDGGEASTGHNHGKMNEGSMKAKDNGHSGHLQQSDTSISAHDMNQMIQQATFNVSGNCDLCKERIEKAANSVKGVLSASWNVDTKKMSIKYNNMQTNPEAVQKAIARVGHDTELVKADDSTYNNLPECCKYRPVN